MYQWPNLDKTHNITYFLERIWFSILPKFKENSWLLKIDLDVCVLLRIYESLDPCSEGPKTWRNPVPSQTANLSFAW